LTYQAWIYFATGQRPTRRGNQHPSIVPYEVFKAADAYLTVGVANNSLWERLCQALDRPDLARDGRFDSEAKRVEARQTLIPLLNGIFATRRVEEWLARFDKAGVPAGRIKSVAEVCESPHLRERGMIVSLAHPKAESVKVFGVPIRLQATPGRVSAPPPLLGQHTDEILTRVAGLSRGEVARLRARGIC
jgi:formyl-CoA transferase/CoA:oxalate CoA-transferase